MRPLPLVRHREPLKLLRAFRLADDLDLAARADLDGVVQEIVSTFLCNVHGESRGRSLHNGADPPAAALAVGLSHVRKDGLVDADRLLYWVHCATPRLLGMCLAYRQQVRPYQAGPHDQYRDKSAGARTPR